MSSEPMSSGITHCFALVDCSNQDSGDCTIVTNNNITSVEPCPGEAGNWIVTFAKKYSAAPAVFAQHAFNGYGGGSPTNGAPALAPVNKQSTFTQGYPSDNAVIVWVSPSKCLVKTGGGATGVWRSFSIQAFGFEAAT